MTGEPRLRLAEDLGEIHHAEAAARGEREQAEPGRLGGGAELQQQAVHGLAYDIKISLCRGMARFLDARIPVELARFRPRG